MEDFYSSFLQVKATFITAKSRMNSISGKVKRRQGWSPEPCSASSPQLSTEGGNQVRLERKGKARSWKVAGVTLKCLNILFICDGVGVGHKYSCYNLRKINLIL